MAKSVIVTYILWLIGGFFGLHHFYLGRNRHAFVWWTTFGGVFGLGYLRDFLRIPEYVRDANEDPEYVKELKCTMSYKKVPPSNSIRWLGQVFTGYLYGLLARIAVPEEFVQSKGLSAWSLVILAVPYAVALGVHLVANIGRQRGSMKSALIGSYMWLPLFLGNFSDCIMYMAVTSTIAVNWKGKSWRLGNYKKHSFFKRLTVLGLCGLLYWSMWGLVLCNRAYITSQDGEKVKLRDALHNFFKSPAWEETKETMWNMYANYKLHGFKNMWDELVKSIDPEGESNAYRVLGVDKSATQAEITAAYRKLARMWHPDKHKDPAMKEEVQTKFMEIQKSYETLSKIHRRRSQKNARTQENYGKDEF